MKDKAFIDTNLLLYLYSADEIDKQNKVKSAFYHYDCFISTQVLNEFSNVLSKKWKVPVPDIKMAINEIKQYCTISFIDMNTIEKALSVHGKYRFSYYDSLMLASALLNDCQTILTEDMKDGQLIEESLAIKNIFNTE